MNHLMFLFERKVVLYQLLMLEAKKLNLLLIPTVTCNGHCHHLFLLFISWACAPLGNRSKTLDIHAGLPDRCPAISLTLLGSYCEPPDCFNSSLRTPLFLLLHCLVTDSGSGLSYTSPCSHKHHRSHVLHYGCWRFGEVCNKKITMAAAH